MKRKNAVMRYFSTAVAIVLCITNLTGCTNKENENTYQSITENSIEASVSNDNNQSDSVAEVSASDEVVSVESNTHIVIDHGGNEVEVPNNINRVVIDQIPILSTYMAYFQGNAPYIVGYCGSFKTIIQETVLKDIAPELMESSDTVYAQSDLNIEEIIKLNPDVIFYNAGNAEHAAILKESGIPAIGFATVGASTDADPLERYKEWMNLLEQVFGENGKMNEFVDAGNSIVADVEARIARIPEEERPSALILWKYAAGVPQVSGNGSFGYYWLKRLGLKDVASDVSGFAQVNLEQVYEWDPDILFLDGPGLLQVTTSQVLSNEVEGIDFSSMTAVKNNRVYNTTLGMWNWFTPNPDAPLVFAWLACKSYPEQFEDYPLEENIKEYYKNWYGYEISDEDLKDMLEY